MPRSILVAFACSTGLTLGNVVVEALVTTTLRISVFIV